MLQCTATRYNTRSPRCNRLTRLVPHSQRLRERAAQQSNMEYHVATRCNALQHANHAATRCNRLTRLVPPSQRLGNRAASTQLRSTTASSRGSKCPKSTACMHYIIHVCICTCIHMFVSVCVHICRPNCDAHSQFRADFSALNPLPVCMCYICTYT